MTIKSIIDFFAVVKEDKSLQQKAQMATDVVVRIPPPVWQSLIVSGAVQPQRSQSLIPLDCHFP